MRDLQSVIYESVSNRMPRGVKLTRHVCDRLVERKLDLHNFVLLLNRDVKPRVCELIYEAKVRHINKVQVKGYGIAISFILVEREYPELVVSTAYSSN